MSPDLFEAFNTAVAAEKAAWERVKDKLPGTPGFDQKLWEEWRRTVAAADKARHALTRQWRRPPS